MIKKILLTSCGLIALLVVIGGTKYLQISTLIAQTPPVQIETVTTADVREEQWEPTISAIGSLSAVQGVTLAAESPGKVVEIAFESGAAVKKGDLLVRIDTSVEEAQLRSAEAAVDLSKIGINRSRDLLGKQSISQSEFDAADAQNKQAVAQADNIRALMAKKTVLAPFAGRLGIRLVNIGQTLKEGDHMVSLQAIDPIYLDFSLPQQRLAQVQVGMTVRLSSDAWPSQTFEGKLTAVNNEIESTTRNVKVQATFTNPNEQLHPGMYGDVSVVLPSKDKVLSIPATAVLYAPYGDSVYVVEDKKDDKTGQTNKVARQLFVRLGKTRGDFVAVTSGLAAGQTIVSTGVFKLRNGIGVVVNNTLAPDAKLAPKPGDS